MTLFIDTSALLPRYLSTTQTTAITSAMSADDDWICSALARSEVLQILRLATTSDSERTALEAAFRADCDACHVVPVDDRCLVRAAELGASNRIPITEAIPLAAADRLPRPAHFLTLSGHQIPAALALDLTVVPE